MNTDDKVSRPSKPLRYFGIVLLYLAGLLSTLATGGDGGGDDGDQIVNQAPAISSLEVGVDSIDYLAGDGEVVVAASFSYSDPEGDVVTLHIESSAGSSLTMPVATSATSGQLSGEILLPTDTAGEFIVEVWVVDGAGNSSNRLTATVRVNGSSELTDLVLTGTTLVPQFAPSVDTYTAEVDFDVEMTTVVATLREAAAVLTIDSRPTESGVESQPVELAVGDNVISVLVSSSDGMMRTIEITVQRRANARLSDLAFSAGMLDQIFQPDMHDYSGEAGFLRSTTRVTAVPEDLEATVQVNDEPILLDWTSADIDLEEGSNTVNVLVSGTDDATTESYSLEIDRSAKVDFTQEAYMKASNTNEEDQFGWSVALSNATLAVGAPFEWSDADGIDGDQSDNNAISAGAVYLFERNPVTGWSQESYVKASNSGDHDFFGWAIALSGDTLAVAAPYEWSSATGINSDQDDNSADSAGAVYIFVRDPIMGWRQQAYIKASNTGFGDQFGLSLALSEDTLVVGAPGEDSSATGVDGDQANDDALSSGAAYVFKRDSAGAWVQTAYLKATNTDAGDGFGRAVGIAGNLVAVGAIGESSATTGINGDQSDNSAGLAGAVYVYSLSDTGQWQPEAYLKAANAQAVDYFGWSIALQENTLAVGARGEDSAATGINGDDTDESDPNAGAAYLFNRDAEGGWSQVAYVKSSNPDEDDDFGNAIALSQNALLIGARYESSGATGIDGDQSNNDWPESGAAYLYLRAADGSWRQRAYLKASNTYLFDNFGWSVALGEDTLAVGARNERSGATDIDGDQSDRSTFGAGAVYVFR